MRAYRWALVRLGRYRWFSWFVASVLTPIEKLLYRLTSGRVSLLQVGRHRALPELVLVTRGARSGAERRTPVLYLEDRARLFVVGSNFGRDRHPAWTTNLRAHPDEVAVVLHGEQRRMRALPASPDDFNRMWPKMLEIWPAWSVYRTRTERDFRAFFLERA
jgi:deazaflavin-dependent oxidoreductase (nitroreductase family)